MQQVDELDETRKRVQALIVMADSLLAGTLLEFLDLDAPGASRLAEKLAEQLEEQVKKSVAAEIDRAIGTGKLHSTLTLDYKPTEGEEEVRGSAKMLVVGRHHVGRFGPGAWGSGTSLHSRAYDLFDFGAPWNDFGLVTGADADSLTRDSALSEELAAPETDLDDGANSSGAVQEGVRFRDAAWAQNEMLRSDVAASRLNLSREGLNQQRQAGKVLGLTASKRGVRYPEWQFEDAVRPNLPPLLSTLSHLDPWGQYLFFIQPEPLLGGESPLQALRQQRASEVLHVAQLLAREAVGG